MLGGIHALGISGSAMYVLRPAAQPHNTAQRPSHHQAPTHNAPSRLLLTQVAQVAHPPFPTKAQERETAHLQSEKRSQRSDERPTTVSARCSGTATTTVFRASLRRAGGVMHGGARPLTTPPPPPRPSQCVAWCAVSVLRSGLRRELPRGCCGWRPCGHGEPPS